CGVGSSLRTAARAASWDSSRMMSLHRLMHSSQMKTEGPAISLWTSCWLLLQKEQCSALSSLEPFFSVMAIQSLGFVGARNQYLVDQSVFPRIVGGHEVVAFGIHGDALDILAGAFGQDVVQTLAQAEDFLRLDLDVRGLALGTARRLVDHDAGIGQGIALALGSGGQQERAHAGGQA